MTVPFRFTVKICSGRRSDGGDGGRGGNIVFVADSNLSTLADFRYKRKYAAKKGENGEAADAVVKMPKTLLSVFLSELL